VREVYYWAPWKISNESGVAFIVSETLNSEDGQNHFLLNTDMANHNFFQTIILTVTHMEMP